MESKKKLALERLKERNFNFPFNKKVLALIEENLHRVQFVNDHIGVRDFLFICEEGLFYTGDFFVALDVECEKENSYQENLELMMQKYTDYPVEVYQKVIRFFEETSRILYVGVGLVESKVIDFDEFMIKVEEGMTEEEALKCVRCFPDWYRAVALDPDDIPYLSVKAEKYISKLKRIEQSLLNEQMNAILMKKELNETDQQTLKKLSCLLKV